MIVLGIDTEEDFLRRLVHVLKDGIDLETAILSEVKAVQVPVRARFRLVELRLLVHAKVNLNLIKLPDFKSPLPILPLFSPNEDIRQPYHRVGLKLLIVHHNSDVPLKVSVFLNNDILVGGQHHRLAVEGAAQNNLVAHVVLGAEGGSGTSLR